MRLAAIDPAPLTWTVHGNPRPQARPRATIRGKHAGVYNVNCPWRKCLGLALRSLDMPFIEAGEPVFVALFFYLGRPGSHYRTGRFSHLLRKDAPWWPLAGGTAASDPRSNVGDSDNYAKAVLDEMNGICFHDDAQVVELSVTKLYADDQPPGVTIIYGRRAEDR